MTNPLQTLQRILVPVDFVDAGDEEQPEGVLTVIIDDHRIVFTKPTLRAAELAVSMGKAFGGTVRLLHATPALQTSAMYSGPVSLPTGLLDELHQRAETTSTTALQQLGSCLAGDITLGEVTLEYVVRPGNPLPVVLEESARFHPDLVVMAASGRSRVARFFVGSTADRLIREAPCPVMVVPAEL